MRVGSLTDLSLVDKDMRDNKTQMTPNEQLLAIYERCHELYPEEERIYNKIMGQLAECGIRQLLPEDLSSEQADYLYAYLQERVVPYLSPQIINSRHPFPHLENGALYVVVLVQQAIGLVGETAILLGLPGGHKMLAASILRFIAFDAAGLVLMAAAFAWLRK